MWAMLPWHSLGLLLNLILFDLWKVTHRVSLGVVSPWVHIHHPQSVRPNPLADMQLECIMMQAGALLKKEESNLLLYPVTTCPLDCRWRMNKYSTLVFKFWDSNCMSASGFGRKKGGQLQLQKPVQKSKWRKLAHGTSSLSKLRDYEGSLSMEGL